MLPFDSEAKVWDRSEEAALGGDLEIAGGRVKQSPPEMQSTPSCFGLKRKKTVDGGNAELCLMCCLSLSK